MTSLYKRLLVRLLASIGALWLVVGGAVYVTVRTSLAGRFDAELLTVASEMPFLFHGGSHPQGAPPSGHWFDFLQKDSGLYFEVWDEYRLFSDRSPNLGRSGLQCPETFGDKPLLWNFTLATGERVRGVAQRFLLDGADMINVVVARNRDALERSLRLLLTAIGLVGALLVPVSFLIVRGAVGQGLRPLRLFADHVASLGFASLGGRLETPGLPAELLPISQRLNELMDRLKEGLERERRLNADLAHELRTPVAELKTMAEVALAWPDQVKAENFRDVLAAAQQMQSVVESMLQLARWDQNPVRPASEAVDLAAMVGKCWQPCAAKAASKRLNVQQVISADTIWQTNQDLLQIILSNLIGNAVEYCPEGGSVRLESRLEEGRPQLAIANSAGDLEDRDLPHLFERFWRRNAARSGSGHAGLGLSLAKSCADILGLDLSAELADAPRMIIFRLADRPRR